MTRWIHIPMVLFMVVVGTIATMAGVDTYRLEVTFQPAASRMEGRAVIRPAAWPPGSELVFYLHGELRVKAVRVGDTQLKFTPEAVLYRRDYSLVAQRVVVDTGGVPPSGDLVVEYAGKFYPSEARWPSDYMRIDADGVLLRSYGYSLWFPVFIDDKSDDGAVDFAEVVIRTPAEFKSVFVGRRTADTVVDGQRITRWQARGVRLRDVQCTARRYEEIEGPGIRLFYSPDPESRAAAREIRTFAERLAGFYRSHYRRDALSGEVLLLEMPRYGDISSNNMTGISRELWCSFTTHSGSKRGLAHELVHPFVRVRVTSDDPLAALAVEGFPCFYHLPALREFLGEEWYGKFMALIEQSYLQKKTTGRHPRGWPLPVEKPLLAITAEEIGTYKDVFVLADRAVLFMNYLYRRMGPERFFAFSRDLFKRESLDAAGFEALIGSCLPAEKETVRIWLHTNEYPESLRLAALR